MQGYQGILIAIVGLSFFIYMTGFTGVMILGIILLILMGLIFFNQNMLLYMPGSLSLTQLCQGYLSHQHKTSLACDIRMNTTYNRLT